MRVVISQSMLFPWVGMLEQVRLADVFVHYDDVQFSKGSLGNRVQIKTAAGPQWMTVPLQGLHLGQSIQAVQIAGKDGWQDRHLTLLRHSFAAAPYAAEALALAEAVYADGHTHLGSLARASLMALVDYFGLRAGRRFVDVQALALAGQGSERVLAIVQALGGSRYLTGHGAARYLDHHAFEAQGVAVDYMNYQRLPYPQSHGEFSPFVSGLDLVAHCGRAGARFIASDSLGWREFLKNESK